MTTHPLQIIWRYQVEILRALYSCRVHYFYRINHNESNFSYCTRAFFKFNIIQTYISVSVKTCCKNLYYDLLTPEIAGPPFQHKCNLEKLPHAQSLKIGVSHRVNGSQPGVRTCMYTANVLTIKIMDFDHVPNPGIMSPQFL